MVKRRAQRAGLTGDFAGHRLRCGFFTEGARQGISLPAWMTITEHRAVASVMGYFLTGGTTNNPAAHVLDD
ncbi:hypothetical protein [Dyella sp. Tek66A03]|uniref:hypothetical protein n=1 Tax=Dyella sp. Tek66A03 TaxID=3458298 RepID=UPI00403EBC71